MLSKWQNGKPEPNLKKSLNGCSSFLNKATIWYITWFNDLNFTGYEMNKKYLCDILCSMYEFFHLAKQNKKQIFVCWCENKQSAEIIIQIDFHPFLSSSHLISSPFKPLSTCPTKGSPRLQAKSLVQLKPGLHQFLLSHPPLPAPLFLNTHLPSRCQRVWTNGNV